MIPWGLGRSWIKEGGTWMSRGGNMHVRIINPPLTYFLLDLIFPNLGTLINYLGPLGLMGPHVPITRVRGTLLEVKFHLLHVHASVWAPLRPIPTF